MEVRLWRSLASVGVPLEPCLQSWQCRLQAAGSSRDSIDRLSFCIDYTTCYSPMRAHCRTTKPDLPPSWNYEGCDEALPQGNAHFVKYNSTQSVYTFGSEVGVLLKKRIQMTAHGSIMIVNSFNSRRRIVNNFLLLRKNARKTLLKNTQFGNNQLAS